jgi:peptidoglycan hydrolase-like protein with peptidoglycan-binding domain
MLLRKGDYGSHIIELQKALKKAGYWPVNVAYSRNFGPTTDKIVRVYQGDKGLVVDGKVGNKTLSMLGIVVKESASGFDEKWKNVTIKGSVFPDKPIKHYNIRLNAEMKNEYLPIAAKVFADLPRGFKLLCTAMAYKEGFRKGTRSHRYNNPGNIGNTDSGANKGYKTLEDGILRQVEYITSIVDGEHRAFPMGKRKVIKPYYSKEVAKHSKMYGMSPWLPGYDFVFTGQLDQFAKIYATGARAGNTYVSTIKSFFEANGLTIEADSKIQDIIKMK